METRSPGIVGRLQQSWNSITHLAELPELNVGVFALLLNFPWEFLQAPLFKGMAAAPHWPATRVCAAAALGDAGVNLVVYWIISASIGSRQWVRAPAPRAIVGFIACIVVLNLGIEKVATDAFGRWAYAEPMPIVPLIRVGAAPLLQWILLPPIALWLVRRQLT